MRSIAVALVAAAATLLGGSLALHRARDGSSIAALLRRAVTALGAVVLVPPMAAAAVLVLPFVAAPLIVLSPMIVSFGPSGPIRPAVTTRPHARRAPRALRHA